MYHGAPSRGRGPLSIAWIGWEDPDMGRIHPLAGQDLLGLACLKVGGSKPEGPSAAIA